MLSRRVLTGVLIPSVYLVLALSIFAWPASNLAPRALPIGLVTAGPEAEGITQALTSRGFDVHRYPTEADASRAIDDRDIYGAIIMTEAVPHALVASAGSAVVAELLRQLATTALPGSPAAQLPTTVVDQVPLPDGDPRGTGFASSLLPIILAGIEVGVLVPLTRLDRKRTVALTATASLIAGLTTVGVLQDWIGILDGGWFGNVAAVSLAIFSLAITVTGLMALVGLPGAGIAAATLVFVGNPLSGVTSAPEMLPQWASAIGQLLQPSAIASLMRSTSFFDGQGSARPVITLTLWAAAGLALLAISCRWSWSQRHTTANAGAPLTGRNAAQSSPAS